MPESIRDFAGRILFGSSLADKLRPPASELRDDEPGAPIVLPDEPGRAAELRFRSGKNSQNPLFRGGDESERGRGLILHHFANHELLALELMALMLLRFPAAPAALRRGLVRMMAEEQIHLGLYLERMRALGVQPGEAALNDFFWRLMSALELPAFVAAMNLTFEQANLDHALYYRDFFDRVGDAATAAVLDRVLADEIGHVRGGLAWFREHRRPGEDDWTAYRRLLPPDLSPVRARGKSFNRAARRAAGLTEDYIDRLEVFADSKGHPARVFVFDPLCDEAVGFGRPGYPEPGAAARLRRDLDTLPALLASGEDIVLVETEVDRDLRLRLARAGFELPRFLPRDRSSEIPAKLAGLYPWGWSPDQRASLLPLFDSIVKAPGPLLDRLRAEFPACLRRVYSKSFGVAVLRDFLATESLPGDYAAILDEDIAGVVVRSIEEIRARIAIVAAGLPSRAGGDETGAPAFVLKSPFSAAGRRRIFLRSTLAGGELEWARGQLAEFGELVLEPWLDRVLDLSCQAEILHDGRVVSHGVIRFLTDAKGAYRAAFVGNPYRALSPGLRRFLDGDGRRSVLRLIEGAAEYCGRRLAGEGYRGPFAVDALVYRDSKRSQIDPAGERGAAGAEEGVVYKCKPIVEINPRFTMGRLAREIARRCRFGSRGLFALLSRRRIQAAGFGGFDEFDADWRARYPLERRASGARELIVAGYLPFNDPARAQEFLALLWCGPGDRPLPALLAEWLPEEEGEEEDRGSIQAFSSTV